MNTALYYPHTELTDPALMKASLLLWDRVEYIRPDNNYITNYPDFLKGAADVLLHPYDVTEKNKEDAGFSIEALTHNIPPEWLVRSINYDRSDYKAYEIYRSKFSDRLIDLLLDKGLANIPPTDRQDFATHTSFGLIMMGALAQCCAGKGKTLITDRLDIHEARARYITYACGGEWKEKANYQQGVRDAESTLVTWSLEVLDPRQFDILELVRMREREDASTKRMRHKYVGLIRRYADDLASSEEREDVERDFKIEVKDIVGELEDKLDRKLTQALFSKEMFVTMAVSMSGNAKLFANAEPWLATFIGLGAIANLALNTHFAREEAKASSEMGYFFKNVNFR